MNRYILCCAVLILASLAVPMCAAEVEHAGGNTPPPGVIRWDTYDVPELKSPGQAYVPPVYQLGYSLADIGDIDVDNLGRLFTMDRARRIVVGFGSRAGWNRCGSISRRRSR